jgi:hypothetical protein
LKREIAAMLSMLMHKDQPDFGDQEAL